MPLPTPRGQTAGASVCPSAKILLTLRLKNLPGRPFGSLMLSATPEVGLTLYPYKREFQPTETNAK